MERHSEGFRSDKLDRRSLYPIEIDDKPTDAEQNAEPTEDCDGSWSLVHYASLISVGQARLLHLTITRISL